MCRTNAEADTVGNALRRYAVLLSDVKETAQIGVRHGANVRFGNSGSLCETL
jgi:hypothetical protein